MQGLQLAKIPSENEGLMRTESLIEELSIVDLNSHNRKATPKLLEPRMFCPCFVFTCCF